MREKIFYPEKPVRCIISGLSTPLFKVLFNIVNDFDKV